MTVKHSISSTLPTLQAAKTALLAWGRRRRGCSLDILYLDPRKSKRIGLKMYCYYDPWHLHPINCSLCARHPWWGRDRHQVLPREFSVSGQEQLRNTHCHVLCPKQLQGMDKILGSTEDISVDTARLWEPGGVRSRVPSHKNRNSLFKKKKKKRRWGRTNFSKGKRMEEEKWGSDEAA